LKCKKTLGTNITNQESFILPLLNKTDIPNTYITSQFSKVDSSIDFNTLSRRSSLFNTTSNTECFSSEGYIYNRPIYSSNNNKWPSLSKIIKLRKLRNGELSIPELVYLNVLAGICCIFCCCSNIIVCCCRKYSTDIEREVDELYPTCTTVELATIPHIIQNLKANPELLEDLSDCSTDESSVYSTESSR